MSYDIVIGNAEIDAVEPDSTEYRIRVARTTLPEAPSFPNDRLTGQSNLRAPAYTAWSEFCRVSGLRELFFAAGTGLMSEHPGCFVLRAEHHRAVQNALAKWRAEHAGSVPGFASMAFRNGRVETDDARRYDPVLARLIWLEWWMGWALTNCARPAIENY